MSGTRDTTAAGDLVSISANRLTLYERAAKPSDLPVEQPTKFQTVLNMRTAQALGLTSGQCSHPLVKVGFVLASLLVGLLAIKLLLILGFLAAYAFMALLVAVWALVQLVLYFWQPLLLMVVSLASARGMAAMRTARAAPTRPTT